MNIYKNLMFLQGHFVDPRDADEDGDASPPPPTAAPEVRAARSGSSETQVAPTRAASAWRVWLTLWPRETAKVEPDCGAAGCT